MSSHLLSHISSCKCGCAAAMQHLLHFTASVFFFRKIHFNRFLRKCIYQTAHSLLSSSCSGYKENVSNEIRHLHFTPRFHSPLQIHKITKEPIRRLFQFPSIGSEYLHRDKVLLPHLRFLFISLLRCGYNCNIRAIVSFIPVR